MTRATKGSAASMRPPRASAARLPAALAARLSGNCASGRRAPPSSSRTSRRSSRPAAQFPDRAPGGRRLSWSRVRTWTQGGPMAEGPDRAERLRLDEARDREVPWRKWGPVREDYSDNGDAWSYFSHDQARSRAYHWGEDGIAGFSDDKQRLCLALALWNGKDPILKERLFGLTNSEGNHGEDVKEYYFYLDSTPTHSYMKYLYKYPHAAYPYDDL